MDDDDRKYWNGVRIKIQMKGKTYPEVPTGHMRCPTCYMINNKWKQWRHHGNKCKLCRCSLGRHKMYGCGVG